MPKPAAFPRLLCHAALIGLLSAGSAFAQTMGTQDQLYQALGGQGGLVKLMDDLVPRLHADPRIAAFFKETNDVNLKKQLVDQFCKVAGGPCEYKGVDMKTAHANMDIGMADFNALVEDLQKSMDAQGIPFRAQNQLLAQLAPMHRAVIATP